MSQKFLAREAFTFTNGAIGYRPGGPFDCVGPYAKVINCPVNVGGEEIHMVTHPDGSHEFIDTRVYLVRRYTCYATSVADTFFSVPANTRIHGRYIRGWFSSNDGGVEFNPYDQELGKIGFAPRDTNYRRSREAV